MSKTFPPTGLDDELDDDLDDEAEAAIAARFLARLDALAEARCAGCEGALCGHELTFSVAFGFQDAPVCLSCFAERLGRPAAGLREELRTRVRRRDCFRQGWERADRREGFPVGGRPGCLWPSDSETTAAPAADAEPTATGEGSAPKEDDHWDAGDMSCGDLVLALRIRLQDMPAGSILKLTATDPAAPVDIPAWCGLTRHPLREVDPPHFWIERRAPHPHA